MKGARSFGAVLFLAVVPIGLAFPADAPLRELLQRVRAWRTANEHAILRELADLLSIPNVASDAKNIRRNADAIAAALAQRGIRSTLLEAGDGPPAVFGELEAPGAVRTVLFYAHYDGQPVDPARWTGDPWKPLLRDGPLERNGKDLPWPAAAARLDPNLRLYARSASDDKAPIVGMLAALDALRAAGAKPSVHLKFFFEGEEEAGSPHLGRMLRAHAARLKADAMLLCDGPVHQSGRKLVFFGARGIVDVELTAYGAVRRLHSGHYGNWSPNPAVALARLVASLTDGEGRILVPGFAEDVRPPTELERRAVAEAPDVDASLERELGLTRPPGRRERVEASVLAPALNVRGFAAGDVGERATNSIPTEATVSIDFRLVPDQTPEKVRRRLEEHLRAQGWHLVTAAPDLATRLAHPRILRLEWGTGYPPHRTAMELPVSRAVAAILSETAGAPVVQVPTLGGSVPSYLFEQILEIPIVGVPIANHDNNQHAANENLRIGNLWDGIEMYAALMAGLGDRWEAPPR